MFAQHVDFVTKVLIFDQHVSKLVFSDYDKTYNFGGTKRPSCVFEKIRQCRLNSKNVKILNW